jgi:type I restriction enzyme S subunit
VGGLPEGWQWVTLADITSQIKDADHKMPKPADSNIPYVSTRDFVGDDDIDFESAKHISEEDYIALTRKIKPEPDNILLSRYGTVGQIRKVKTDRPFQASYSIAIIKPLANKILSNFLVALLRSEIGQQQMRDNIRASSQPDLGLESIRKFTFPLPPLEEQRRIVEEVERRLESARAVESAVDAGLKRAGRLRQAVLRSAFEGRL